MARDVDIGDPKDILSRALITADIATHAALLGHPILDDELRVLGTDNDIAMLLRSTVLNADTALTGVLIGTPDTTALAANSLIISNITEDGDILIAVNDGGTSKQMLFIDGSAGIVHIGIPGTPSHATARVYIAEEFEVDGETFLDGTCRFALQAILNGGIYLADTQHIKCTGLDNSYFIFKAKDTSVGDVEIGRVSGATEPWFGIGKDSDVVKATYDDKLGFFSTTPVAKPTGVAVSAAGIHAALVTLGLIAA